DPGGQGEGRVSSNNCAFARRTLRALGEADGLDKTRLLARGGLRVSWVPAMQVMARPESAFLADGVTRFRRGRHYASTRSAGWSLVTGSGRAQGILVVGVGCLGAMRARAAAVARGTRVVAVVDREARRAQGVADRLGAVAAPDFAAALALPGVDAVVVATPHADHGEQVRLALEAGKHVLCENPLTIAPDEARGLALPADQRGLRLATG